MTYDPEHIQHPQDPNPDSTEQHISQAAFTEPGRAPGEPTVSGDDAHRTPGSELFSPGDRDKLTTLLQQALSTFVESPRQAVEEADHAFDTAATQLADALAERRRTLRAHWQGRDGTEPQTEELRLALRGYRESMERLLRI
ncbi:hypothetical protein [Streptomyces sp. N35]|uniref:hypothetical protein n=1 Tax=Streptomyces sp. N35 TaxID=2795730 RepID=UPI001F32BE68|nr:hypothetical protein [Streptomyces sp. N35]